MMLNICFIMMLNIFRLVTRRLLVVHNFDSSADCHTEDVKKNAVKTLAKTVLKTLREILPQNLTQRAEIVADITKSQDTKAAFFKLHKNAELLIIADLAQLSCSITTIPSFSSVSQVINEVKETVRGNGAGIILLPEIPPAALTCYEEACKLQRQISELLGNLFPNSSCVRFEFSCIAEVENERGPLRAARSIKRLVRGVVVANSSFEERQGLIGFVLQNCPLLSSAHIPSFPGIPWAAQAKYSDCAAGLVAEEEGAVVSNRAIKAHQRGWKFFAELLLGEDGFNLNAYVKKSEEAKSNPKVKDEPLVLYDLIPSTGDIWVVALVNRLHYYGCYSRRAERVCHQVALSRMV